MTVRDHVRCEHSTRRRSWGLDRFFTGLRSFLQRRRGALNPRTFLVGFLVVLLGGTLCLQVLWQHTQAARLKVQITELERENHSLRMKIHRKEIAVSRLERLDRIRRLASAELGMRPRERVAVLEMSPTHWAQSSGGRDRPVQP